MPQAYEIDPKDGWMIATGAFLLILLLLGALLLGLSIGGRYPRRPRLESPACGKCHYPVRGMPTFVCPECGADVREAGIVLPRRPRRSRELFIMFGIAAVAMVTAGGVMAVMAQRQAVSSRKMAARWAAVSVAAQRAQAQTRAQTPDRPTGPSDP